MFCKPSRTLFTVVSLMLTLGVVSVIAQEEPYAPVIAPANFVEGVNHSYFSLIPGTTFVYEGETEDGLERTEVSVMPETKLILGVSCTVVRDTVWLDGELIEDTFDWYAQDRDGNVWYMGEETREYEDGVVVSTAGAWEAGVDGAQPGIVMQTVPQVGESYRQEHYAGEAEDMAEVLSLDESASVSYGTFNNLLMTNEWTPLQPDVAEHKYYASGVGLLLEVVVAGGTGQSELVDIITRDPMAEDDDESEAIMPAGTLLISVSEALEFAQSRLLNGAVHEVELEYESGRWVYSVETEADEVTVDAITGDLLVVENAGDDD